jgi:hypothetical protein
MTIDFDDDEIEDLDDEDHDEMEDIDDGEYHDEVEDLDDDEHHDEVEDLDDGEHHDEVGDPEDGEYVPPVPQRLSNPRSLSPVLSAKPRSGGLWPCGVPNCSCRAYDALTEGNDCSCTHSYKLHLNGRY